MKTLIAISVATAFLAACSTATPLCLTDHSCGSLTFHKAIAPKGTRGAPGFHAGVPAHYTLR